MSTQPRSTFINLPVGDLPAAKAFYTQLGFEFDPKFTNEVAACMVVSPLTYAMLVSKPMFEGFVAKPVGDPHAATSAIVCISAEDREAVDAFADAALAAGGARATEPQDHGFMYGRSFYDLDGHHWEVMWMSQEAVEQGPAGVEPAAT